MQDPSQMPSSQLDSRDDQNSQPPQRRDDVHTDPTTQALCCVLEAVAHLAASDDPRVLARLAMVWLILVTVFVYDIVRRRRVA